MAPRLTRALGGAAVIAALAACGSQGSNGDGTPQGSSGASTSSARSSGGGSSGVSASRTAGSSPTGGGSSGPAAASSASGSTASTASGSRDAGAGVVDAGGSTACKRGIATNTAPSSALAATASSAGVSWWYNWAAQGAAGAGIEFDPMIWGSGSLDAKLPAGSRYVLGFNEPNFKAQSNLTAAQAAADWPMVQAAAKATGAALVAPAVNYCGSSADPSGCSDPSVTDPYTWLKDFFAACGGCTVDYVAVHWYNCDLPSLKAYLEGNLDAGGGLQGFVQFGKPIWLTEFACDNSHGEADQEAYMRAAVPYLEGNPHVFRYSWFNASNIANALVMNADGTLTTLGKVYVGLPQSCPP
jgi:hypothetical protein